MKLYHIYRHKKFGEPLQDDVFTSSRFTILDDSRQSAKGEIIPRRLQDQEYLIFKKIEELNKALGHERNKSPGQAISDLHTVKEDDDDENEEDDLGCEAMDPNLNPDKFVRSATEYQNHIQSFIESAVIFSELKQQMQSISKVKCFLLMVIQRSRFLKKRRMIRLVQKYTKSYISWKEYRKELIAERDFRKVEALKFQVRKASDMQRDRMDQAAFKI